MPSFSFYNPQTRKIPTSQYIAFVKKYSSLHDATDHSFNQTPAQTCFALPSRIEAIKKAC